MNPIPDIHSSGGLMDERMGKGILMSRREFDEVQTFDERLGLRELRFKIHGKAGVNPDGMPSNFLSIWAERCYGTNSIAIVRQYLDGGALARLLESEEFGAHGYEGVDGHRYITLYACLMTLGCAIPTQMTQGQGDVATLIAPAHVAKVKRVASQFSRPAPALSQLKKAIDKYQPGTPYDFGNTPFIAAVTSVMFGGNSTTVTNHGSMKMIETKMPNGMVIPQMCGPPADEEIGMEHLPVHAAHVCAHCGKTKGEEGKELMSCARCLDRKYCSRGCQKKHWKLHQAVCAIPKDEMDAVMAAATVTVAAGTKEAGVKGGAGTKKATAANGNAPSIIVSAGMAARSATKGPAAGKKALEGSAEKDMEEVLEYMSRLN